MSLRLLMPAIAVCASITAVAEDAAPTSLVREGAEVKQIGDKFKFTEGACVAPNGDFYFVDKNDNKIFHWNVTTEELRVVSSNSYAANGMMFDAKGRLIACQGTKRSITAFDPETGEELEVLTSAFEGKKFNNPNDLWIDPKGGIYFTDPKYKQPAGPFELETKPVFYLAPGAKEPIIVDEKFNTPNGIVGDGKGTLYITDRRLKRVYKYTINDDGTLADKTLFCKEGADGMTLDSKGNLYVTPDKPEIRIYGPDGVRKEKIPLPGAASNLAFGGKDGSTLLITARGRVYTIQMNVEGGWRP